MLRAIVALKFAHSAKIDDKKFRLHGRKSASSYFPSNTMHLVSWKFISTGKWSFVNSRRLLRSSTLPAVQKTHPLGRYILWAILLFSYQKGKHLDIYLTQCMLFDYRLGKHGLPYNISWFMIWIVIRVRIHLSVFVTSWGKKKHS